VLCRRKARVYPPVDLGEGCVEHGGRSLLQPSHCVCVLRAGGRGTQFSCSEIRGGTTRVAAEGRGSRKTATSQRSGGGCLSEAVQPIA
jgi:hypothetical protein